MIVSYPVKHESLFAKEDSTWLLTGVTIRRGTGMPVVGCGVTSTIGTNILSFVGIKSERQKQIFTCLSLFLPDSLDCWGFNPGCCALIGVLVTDEVLM